MKRGARVSGAEYRNTIPMRIRKREAAKIRLLVRVVKNHLNFDGFNRTRNPMAKKRVPMSATMNVT